MRLIGCERGAYGTGAAPHQRGAPVHQLKECFGLFVPDHQAAHPCCHQQVDDHRGRDQHGFVGRVPTKELDRSHHGNHEGRGGEQHESCPLETIGVALPGLRQRAHRRVQRGRSPQQIEEAPTDVQTTSGAVVHAGDQDVGVLRVGQQ